MLTNNFIRILNSNYIFVNADVSYHNSHNFFEKVNNSKFDINNNKERMILIFLLLPSSIFHLMIKQKPEVRIKIIPLAIFSLLIIL